MIQGIDYLDPILLELAKRWPSNRTVNIVCHGHSVPAGYFATPFVNTFSAYPHLLHRLIKERFPFAVANVIVTASGGESSVSGEARFERDVLSLRPDVLTIDYSLNDRSVGLDAARGAWEKMISAALDRSVKVILCTPTWDDHYYLKDEKWDELSRHAEQVRALADSYGVGLADFFEVFERNVEKPSDLSKYLSHVNHPSEAGHMLCAEELAKYFIAK